MKISIIIAAYKAEKYIARTLQSIHNQSYFKNNDYEILIGVDNCKPTLDALATCNLKNCKIFYFKDHCYPYIIFNTLAQKSSENIQFFGADDEMNIDMIAEVMKVDKEFVKVRCQNYNHIWRKFTDIIEAEGAFFIKKSLFDRVGGFPAFKVSGDTEFKIRCEKNNIACYRIKKVLFIRHQYQNNLTFCKDLGMSSVYRQKIYQLIKSPNYDYTIPLKAKINNNYIEIKK